MQSSWHGKQLMKTSSIRSNIFQKPFATGAPPQTLLREIPLDPLLKNCVAPLTLRSKSIGHFDCCPIREKVKQNSLYKKSNIIDYQYNPILFIFLSWHAKYFVHSNVWILARDAEKVRHPCPNSWSQYHMLEIIVCKIIMIESCYNGQYKHEWNLTEWGMVELV